MEWRPLLVLAAVGAAAWLQGPAGEANALRRRNDFRYTPDPRVIRVVAGAHRSTMADLLWLRTLPDLSREFSDAEFKARWIDNSLDAITDLEPSFWTVYAFGQSYLFNPGRPTPQSLARAEKLLRKGIKANPANAGLRVYLAMAYYFADRPDTQRTMDELKIAAMLPGFDSLSASFLTALQARARQDFEVLGYWVSLLDQGTPEMRHNAEMMFWTTKNEIVRRAAREFEAKEKRKPATAADVANADLVDPRVVDVIREGLEITPDGAPRYPKLDELAQAERILDVERWCRTFRDEAGRWPVESDLAERGFKLPPAPAGKTWKFADGKLVPVGD